jgi:hypothetical protein
MEIHDIFASKSHIKTSPSLSDNSNQTNLLSSKPAMPVSEKVKSVGAIKVKAFEARRFGRTRVEGLIYCRVHLGTSDIYSMANRFAWQK